MQYQHRVASRQADRPIMKAQFGQNFAATVCHICLAVWRGEAIWSLNGRFAAPLAITAFGRVRKLAHKLRPTPFWEYLTLREPVALTFTPTDRREFPRARLYDWRYLAASNETQMDAALGKLDGNLKQNTLLELKLDPAIKPVTASRHF